MKRTFKGLLSSLVLSLVTLFGVIYLQNPNPARLGWRINNISYAPLAARASEQSILPLLPATQGAQIDESRVTKVLCVDNSSSASVSICTGSEAQPFTSIQQALTAAKADILSGVGVRVLIKPGVYREELYIEGTGIDNAPLIIEAAAAGQVIISGADVFSAWQPAQERIGVYQHTWTNNWGTIENPWRKQFGQGNEAAYPDFRREMFYLNGKPLSQKLRFADLQPGSFWIDEATDRVLLWPPDSVDINTVLVEGAMRSANQDFGVLKTYKLNNLILRNLTITQGSVAVWGSTRLSGNNILIEDCHFDRNNGVGLAIDGEQITIRRSTANENGHAGVLLDGRSYLVEQTEASWNGWKLKEWGYEDCSGAGIKFGDSTNILVRNTKFVGNSYPGLWFDEDCTDITVDNVFTFANESAGIDWETSDDLRVSRLYSAYNQFGWRSYDGSRVNLKDSVIAFNRTLQMFISNTDRKYNTDRWAVSNVTIAANVGNQHLLWDTWLHEPGSYSLAPNNTMDQFATTLTAVNNTYFHPSFDAVFRKGDGTPLSLAQWQSYTGQEVGSVWDGNQVAATMNSLKIDIGAQWGNPNTSSLGYHNYPNLPL